MALVESTDITPLTVDRLKKNIRAALGIAGTSQSEVAPFIGLTGQTFSDRMRGKARWTAIEIQQLAAILNIPTDALLAPTDEAFRNALVTSPNYSLVESAAYEQGELALDFPDAPFTRPFPVAAA